MWSVSVLIVMETFCHLEEMYYFNIHGHSLYILATHLTFLPQIFNASGFRMLANIGSIFLKILRFPKGILLNSHFNEEKKQKNPKVPTYYVSSLDGIMLIFIHTGAEIERS